MPHAYFNEMDREKAEWLRELIKEGAIADGEVDERSIQSVQPGDVSGYTQCHWFAGVGIWSYALRLAGWPDDRPVWTGSCPCPSFSAAGKGQGFDDPRHLWPDWYRLIRECGPPVVLGEQVSAAIGHGWLDLVQTDLEAAHYAVGKAVLGACCVGAPHKRQRLYFVADSDIGGYDGRRPGATGYDPKEAERGFNREPSEKLRDVIGLADSESGDGQVLLCERGPRQAGYDPGRSGEPGLLGHTISPRLEGWAGQPGDDGSQCETAERTGDPFGMDHAAGARHDGPFAWAEGDSRDEARLRVPGERSPVSGFWRDAAWVLTRPQRVGDRPGLRAIESAPLGMDAGLAADLGYLRTESGYYAFPLQGKAKARTMRLRGYGDAINVEVAAEFIRSYMEVRDA